MKKNVGLTYVDSFSFPPEQGFTGSAGKSSVKGYMRGGRVQKTKAEKTRVPAIENYPSEHISKNPPKKARVKDTVKAAAQKKRAPGPGAAGGGYANDMHAKLKAEGGKMGYKYGGSVSNTSAEFVQKKGAQDPMDHGTYAKGAYANEAEKEAGGRKKVRPKFEEGGLAKYAEGGSIGETTKKRIKGRKKRVGKTMAQVMAAQRKAMGLPPKKSKKMPKNVKARGGKMEYAEGGNVGTPPSTGMLGKGAARRNVQAMREREGRVRATVDKALSQSRMTRNPAAPAPPPRAAAKPKPKTAPGAQRGKRPHYGMPFKGKPSVGV